MHNRRGDNTTMVTKIEVEQYAAATNAAVIRLPGRKFPGVVLQGDSLKVLPDCAEDVARLAEHASPDLKELIQELRDHLQGYLRVYEDTLKTHGQALPYVSRVG